MTSDYYGANFDALWDCLTDFLGCISHIYFLGMERVKDKFPSFYEKFTALLQDVKHAFRGQFADRFCVFFIHSDGSVEELL